MFDTSVREQTLDIVYWYNLVQFSIFPAQLNYNIITYAPYRPVASTDSKCQSLRVAWYKCCELTDAQRLLICDKCGQCISTRQIN